MNHDHYILSIIDRLCILGIIYWGILDNAGDSIRRALRVPFILEIYYYMACCNV